MSIFECEEPDSKYSITITCDSEKEDEPASLYIATSAYHTEDTSQLSFPEGALIRVLEKNQDGQLCTTIIECIINQV